MTTANVTELASGQRITFATANGSTRDGVIDMVRVDQGGDASVDPLPVIYYVHVQGAAHLFAVRPHQIKTVR